MFQKLTFGNDVRRVLAKIKDWDFDVFALESLTPYPLVIVTEATLQQLNLTWKLELNISKLKRFLLEVQDAYISTNPYHNYIHATDCTQTMFHMLTQCQAINALGLGDLAILAMMLSAAIHDVAHPGVTGRYLISISAPLAIQYNDTSPLENLHLATTFNVLMKPANNFTDRLSKLQYRELRRLVIEMVLFIATVFVAYAYVWRRGGLDWD